MLVRFIRWFLILAPVLAGVLLLIFGTQGITSQTFGATLIAVGVCVWLWNIFVRMTIAETTREEEAEAREARARMPLGGPGSERDVAAVTPPVEVAPVKREPRPDPHPPRRRDRRPRSPRRPS